MDSSAYDHDLQCSRVPIYGVSQDLYDHVLFNYKWLYAKSSALPLNELLSDFEDAVNNIEDAVAVKEINLVADSIRLGGAILKYYPEMLAAQVRLWPGGLMLTLHQLSWCSSMDGCCRRDKPLATSGVCCSNATRR